MSSTTSESILPRHIDPRKFAQQGITIQGNVDLGALERVSSLLANKQGNINAELVFGIDEQGIRYLTGAIDATVNMICQRCLNPASQSLQMRLNLGFIWDDESADKLPKTYDPWIVGEGQTDIYDVIADELILGLPIVAYHAEACVPQELFSAGNVDKQSSDKAASNSKTDKSNPFQVLEQLKGSLNKASDKPEE